MKPPEFLPDAEAVARRAAALLADAASEAIRARGAFHVAFSGGGTPNRMFEVLATLPCDWARWHVWQVDERAAPNGHPDRNIEALTRHLLLGGPGHQDPTPPLDSPGEKNEIDEQPEADSPGVAEGEQPVRSLDHDLTTRDLSPAPPGGGEAPAPGPRLPVVVHPMRVTGDLEAGAEAYAEELRRACEGVLDVVHLGLGPDGHTASLVPGDRSLNVLDRDVTFTEPYKGWARMTLTYPAIARARSVLWVVTGAEKRDALRKLLDGDFGIPAGHVARGRAVLLADEASRSTG